jgi:hypothetical protein
LFAGAVASEKRGQPVFHCASSVQLISAAIIKFPRTTFYAASDSFAGWPLMTFQYGERQTDNGKFAGLLRMFS